MLVPDEAFVGVEGIKGLMESKKMKESLVSQGYLDQDYISSKFNPKETIKVEIEFSPSEGLVEKEKIIGYSNEELYLLLVNIGTLKEINSTHAILNPEYN